MLVRTADSSAIRIYLSTEPTTHKLYTLMHDPQYRTDVARQNTGYNQPSYTSFYFASDMDWANVPIPKLYTPKALMEKEGSDEVNEAKAAEVDEKEVDEMKIDETKVDGAEIDAKEIEGESVVPSSSCSSSRGFINH